MKAKMTVDTREFERALRRYADVRKMSLGDALKRRAVSVSIKLIRLYQSNAPTREDIESQVESLGWRVKVRPALKTRGARSYQVKREVSARVRAIRLTSMGWIVAGSKFGLRGRRVLAKFRGLARGSVRMNLHGRKMFVEINNEMPGAAPMDQKGDLIQKALDGDARDMTSYIHRKLEKQSQRAGLK